jgi:intracellular multiplication protein IcmV
MGLWSGVKKVAKPFVDVSSWLNVKQIKSYGSSIIDVAKDLFIPQTAQHTETFEQATRRLGLSEKDLQKRAHEFRLLALMFSLIALSLLGYLIYLIIVQSSFLAKLVTIALMLMVLAKLFNYHFWLFQIKNRRLGCTLKEWFTEGLLGMKK